MRIGQLAQRLGVNPKTVRYYESIALLPEPARTPSGYRDYGEEDFERILFIKTAQRLNITLDEIREILAFRERDDRPCDYVLDVLRRHTDELDARIAEMRQLRDEMVELQRAAESVPERGNGYCPVIEHRQGGRAARA